MKCGARRARPYGRRACLASLAGARQDGLLRQVLQDRLASLDLYPKTDSSRFSFVDPREGGMLTVR